MKKITPLEIRNFEKYKISERYSVVFYTTKRYAVFRYYVDDGIDLCETNRSCVYRWISPNEKEKLLAFKREKKEKYIGYELYDGSLENDDWKKV